jgi:hypothetical protein
MKCGRNLCVVVIPIYKTDLREYEIHSLRKFAQVFSSRDIYILAPERLGGILENELGKLDPSLGGLKYAWFADKHFGSVRTYNRLMLDPHFYQRFIEYEYMLIAQTDAFVFEDGIDMFASMEYDYLGAPWFQGYDYAGENSELLPYCGNGGFSMRRIRSFLNVLMRADQTVEPLREIIERVRESSLKAFLPRLCENIVDWVFHNKVGTFGESISRYEDYFWARCACRIVPAFASAPPEIGMKFAFETNPALLYKKNGDRLPMGCHGWWKYDLDFWKPHIGVR